MRKRQAIRTERVGWKRHKTVLSTAGRKAKHSAVSTPHNSHPSRGDGKAE